MSLSGHQSKLNRRIEKTHLTIRQSNMVQLINNNNNMLHQTKELLHSIEEPKLVALTAGTHIQLLSQNRLINTLSIIIL
jgi:hypothetical protein